MFVFKAAVVGAGTMGAEIAQAIAAAGLPVVLKDVDQTAIDHALDAAASRLDGLVTAGKLDPAERDRQLALISGTLDYRDLGDADFVIEAVPEEMALKRQVFTELDEVAPGHAILASTTSSLSITELGEGTGRPDRVLGFHVPAPATRLIEVVEGQDTSVQSAQAAANFAAAIRKTPIRCGEAPGFVVNRILEAAPAEPADRRPLRALTEACVVLEEGEAALRDIDLGMMTAAGMLPPPFRWADEIGLDVVLDQLESAAERWGEAFPAPTVLRRLVGAGRLGIAAGQGFYPYPRPEAGSEDRPVKLETREQIAIVWLDRPPANSLSPEMIAALREAWDAVSAREEIRAVVFASANPMLFCAGADIKAFAQMDEDAGRELLDAAHGLFAAFESSRIATVAAVNAGAFGGGCELAMACDLRIVAESATFGQPEINLGIIPGFGGTQRLPRLIGAGRARELNLTGEPIGAIEALEYGLATRVVPDHELFDVALAWARKLAGQAPLAVEQIKRLGGHGDLATGLAAEREAFAALFASQDAREGIGAFVQKRSARFEGR